MSGPCNEAVYHSPHDKAGVIIGKGLHGDSYLHRFLFSIE